MSADFQASKTLPLKVLHIAPTPFFSDRGCHMRINGLIGALTSRNVRNILCTYHLGRDIRDIETIRTIKIPGYNKTEAGPNPFKYVADIFLFFTSLRAIKREKPNIIYGHLHEGILLAWAVNQCFFWRKIPLIFDMQGSLVGELDAHGYFDKFKFLKRFFLYIEKLIVVLPDYIVCSAKSSADILEEQFQINSDRIRVVNDGGDIFDAPAEEASKSLKAKLNLPDNKTIVIYTGALLPAKGLDELCQIILDAKRRSIDCHFLVLGYPVEKITQFASQNDLQDYCTFTGRVAYENLGNYLSLADIAIEPKLADSGEASGKLLNYMGAGLPVVCFDTLNNRQILDDNGIFVSIKNKDTFALYLDELINDLGRARDMGKLNRKRAENVYSWQAAANSLFILFNEFSTNN